MTDGCVTAGHWAGGNQRWPFGMFWHRLRGLLALTLAVTGLCSFCQSRQFLCLKSGYKNSPGFQAGGVAQLVEW